MKRLIPLIVTLLLLALILAAQIWFLATGKDAGYLIIGFLLILIGTAAAVAQVLLLSRRR